MPYESIAYAAKYPLDEEPGFWYSHVFTCAFPVFLSDGKTPVVKIRVRESMQGDDPHTYWGWWDNKEQKFTFVYRTRAILSMVFPYGLESEIERGRGQAIEVTIDELETFTREEAENAPERWYP